jgi:hypothetical protein
MLRSILQVSSFSAAGGLQDLAPLQVASARQRASQPPIRALRTGKLFAMQVMAR